MARCIPFGLAASLALCCGDKGVFDARGTAYGLGMFDLFAVLLPRDEAKQKWKKYNGGQGKPPLPGVGQASQHGGPPYFERGQSREGSATPNLRPTVTARDQHLFRSPSVRRSATTTPSLSKKPMDPLANL